MVDGDPRGYCAERYRDTFGFAEVMWVENATRHLQRIAAQLESGTQDLLVINRYCGHIVDDISLAPIKSDLTRWVSLEGGYGVNQLRAAMEAHWSGLVAPAR